MTWASLFVLSISNRPFIHRWWAPLILTQYTQSTNLHSVPLHLKECSLLTVILTIFSYSVSMKPKRKRSYVRICRHETGWVDSKALGALGKNVRVVIWWAKNLYDVPFEFRNDLAYVQSTLLCLSCKIFLLKIIV